MLVILNEGSMTKISFAAVALYCREDVQFGTVRSFGQGYYFIFLVTERFGDINLYARLSWTNGSKRFGACREWGSYSWFPCVEKAQKRSIAYEDNIRRQ